MITLKIPPPDCVGYCDDVCLFRDDAGDLTFCRIKLEADPKSIDDAQPGPACAPGEYVLVPKAQWEAAEETCHAAMLFKIDEPQCVGAHFACGSEVCQGREDIVPDIARHEDCYEREIEQLRVKASTLEMALKCATDALQELEKADAEEIDYLKNVLRDLRARYDLLLKEWEGNE